MENRNTPERTERTHNPLSSISNLIKTISLALALATASCSVSLREGNLEYSRRTAADGTDRIRFCTNKSDQKLREWIRANCKDKAAKITDGPNGALCTECEPYL